MTIRVDIHPDTREKYIITVSDPGQPDNDILLSSTSQGYEGVANPEALVRRLFGGPTVYMFGGAGGVGPGGAGGGGAVGTITAEGLSVVPGQDAPSSIESKGGAGGGGGVASSASSFAAGGAGAPEPVELYVTYLNGRVRGPERIR